jgi:hypothetical protein
MLASFFALILALVGVAAWAFVIYILWHILLALQSIDRSVDDVAKSLRVQK